MYKNWWGGTSKRRLLIKQIVKIQQIDNVPVVFELTTVSKFFSKAEKNCISDGCKGWTAQTKSDRRINDRNQKEPYLERFHELATGKGIEEMNMKQKGYQSQVGWYSFFDVNQIMNKM